MLILLCFVIQAVSYEYQAKKGNLLGKKTYQVFLIINGVLGPILLGTAVATFFNGAEFSVNKGQMTDIAMPVISTWNNSLHGLEAAFVIWNVCLGLAVFFLARVQALLYFINNIDNKDIVSRCRKRLIPETALFLVFFLIFLVRLLLVDGFAVNPETQEVFMQPYKYFINLIQMPAVLVVLLAGVVRYYQNNPVADMAERHLVCRNRNSLDRTRPAALRRMEQHGLLSVHHRPAEFADNPEQLFKSIYIESDELRIYPGAFRSGVYLLCLACTRPA